MSSRIFVICEDHTLDQYIVRPVVAAAAARAGKGSAQVRVVTSPRLRGISDVERNFSDLVERYCALGDGVVFALDLDLCNGLHGRSDRAARFDLLRRRLPADVQDKVLVVLAEQEVEVWALWGVRSQLGAPWSQVRQERDPKEAFFNPLVTSGDRKAPGQGRGRLIAESLAGGWTSFVSGCPEADTIADFVRRICA